MIETTQLLVKHPSHSSICFVERAQYRYRLTMYIYIYMYTESTSSVLMAYLNCCVGVVPRPRQKMSAAEQADAMIEHLDRTMAALEQDKLTGARSVSE